MNSERTGYYRSGDIAEIGLVLPVFTSGMVMSLLIQGCSLLISKNNYQLVNCSDNRGAIIEQVLGFGQETSMQPITGDGYFKVGVGQDGGLIYHNESGLEIHLPSGEIINAKGDLVTKPNSSVSFTDRGADFTVTGKVLEGNKTEVIFDASCK